MKTTNYVLCSALITVHTLAGPKRIYLPDKIYLEDTKGLGNEYIQPTFIGLHKEEGSNAYITHSTRAAITGEDHYSFIEKAHKHSNTHTYLVFLYTKSKYDGSPEFQLLTVNGLLTLPENVQRKTPAYRYSISQNVFLPTQLGSEQELSQSIFDERIDNAPAAAASDHTARWSFFSFLAKLIDN